MQFAIFLNAAGLGAAYSPSHRASKKCFIYMEQPESLTFQTLLPDFRKGWMSDLGYRFLGFIEIPETNEMAKMLRHLSGVMTSCRACRGINPQLNEIADSSIRASVQQMLQHATEQQLAQETPLPSIPLLLGSFKASHYDFWEVR